ncbi:DUF429 domain-containing protein [Gordonia bronchialis]|uniref:DUF429 domain-containing protein n=1 Tax=Gordonia bronchialis TaxID=2054 RepID=UPI001CBC78B9|nr:DUF429 domain-containing protein [Gordonia bronchialis]UAK36868.1 DUF429 domain-containing protein [Gordonia bronchialis]
MTRTVGVDLAASPSKTAVAVVEWRGSGASVTGVAMPADDAVIRELADGAQRIGVDAPFGWPDSFVEFVGRHHRGRTESGLELDDVSHRRPLAYRRTDLVVADLPNGRRPLSVSANQIAHVAFRCAGLLADLGVDDRVDGWAVEAYPAAALTIWGLRPRGYKRVENRPVRAIMVTELDSAAPWLELGDHAQAMIDDDDIFDAVITALIARAAALGRTRRPTPADLPIALREGWIHVPVGGLDELPLGSGG